jgi:3D (Asp-Asp-Asp) domain-containing protein/LysM repeat protein
MKKFVASLAAGILIAGATVTTASAQEHEVQSGESLWKIANKYSMTIDELIQINQLKSTVIHPKQVIQLSEEEEAEETTSHKVEKGDTLGKIANEHNVSVTELKAWNNLNSDLIIPGDVLALNGEKVQQETAPEAEVSSETVSEETPEPVSEEENNTNETAQAEQEEAPAKEESNTEPQAEGKTISVTATAYTADCAGCSGVTATGVDLNNDRNAKVIAVDPSVIPLGSEVYVEGYGYATAADTGGAINGNKIDLHMPTKEEALNWGNRTVNVTVVD